MLIANLYTHKDTPVEGEWRLDWINNQPMLTDRTGKIPLEIANGAISPTTDEFNQQAAIQMRGQFYWKNGVIPTVVLEQYQSKHSVTGILELHPHRQNHDPERLSRLIVMVQQISNPALRTFCEIILSSSERLTQFLSAPGSYSHHHSYPGGLTDHSIEMAEAALNGQNPLLATLEDREVVAVACLFHDIGKIRTLQKEGPHRLDGLYLDHQPLLWEYVMNGLQTLEMMHNNSIALALRTIWSEAHQKSSCSRYPLSLAMRQLDQASAMNNAYQLAFQQAQPWQKIATLGPGGGGRQFVRLN